jgi:GT2 family glycosyltransferase
MTRISILIAIYNRLEITQRGLASLYDALGHYQQAGKATCQFEVVVVDDGSTDGSSSWIAANYPSVHLLQGTGDLWWSGATNAGARYAINTLHSDFLLLWNDDISPHSSYFVEMEELTARPDAPETVFGSKILAAASGKIWSIGGYFTKWGQYGMYRDPGTNSSAFFECDWLPGMGTLVPASAVRDKQLLWDEKQFPQYHGDSDYTLRCKENGYKIKTSLDLIIYNASENPGAGGFKTLKSLWWSMVSIRSNYNFRKRLVFYHRHGAKPLNYYGLFHTYLRHIGSFFKRNILKIPAVSTSQPKA